ncbi:hypothetical protein ACIGFL_04075 [Pseudomonas sp. NPDC077649]|uniref:DUF7281 domain-containing protein n=1 Tax=Pseudomonas sp. NPDC077649 TaxID=3364423 RepID=UPI0037C5BDE8
MSRSLADALEKLLVAGGKLASSQLTTAQRRVLEEFAHKTQSVRLTTSGRGSLYQIIGYEQVVAHLSQLRPEQREQLSADLPQRALNVARYRDSKMGGTKHALQYLLLKAVSEGQCWQDGKGSVLELSMLTQTCGVAGLAVRVGDGWHTGEPLWLIENQALFDDTSWLPAGASGTLCYYSGQLSSLMLDWLTEQPRASRVILFPDYDGIGLQNFARLYELLGDTCIFWLMPDWLGRLRLYGNRQIWQDNFVNFQDALGRLQVLGVPSELAELCSAMQRMGLALEQESVYLLPEQSQRPATTQPSDDHDLIEIAKARLGEKAIPVNLDDL